MLRHAARLLVIAGPLYAALPAQAAKGDIHVGVGYTTGEGSSDASTVGDVDFLGGTALGTFGLAAHWGIELSYRHMKEDDLPFPVGSQDYQAFGLAAVYTFRPLKFWRPRLDLGYTSTDAEFTSFVGNTQSDQSGALSYGLGLEFGRRWSGFVEADRTEPELFDVDVEFTNYTVGFTVRVRGKR